MPESSRYLVWRAVLDTLPLAIAVIPWGVLTGALGIQIGLTPWQAQAMSLLVFAGAAQLSAMTLMPIGASIWSLMGSTFVISSRHLLYSVTFRSHVNQLSLTWRATIAFLLTDEMFAVSEAHTRRSGKFSPLFALVSGITFYLAWNLSTLIGVIAGDWADNLDQLGLDFAIIATFVAMTFDRITERPILVAISISGISAVLLQPVFSDAYIIFASLIGMTCAYLVDSENADSISESRD